MGLKTSKLEMLVAEHYSPLFFKAVKFGENGVCVWFPGAGKSTIVQNIISSRTICQAELKNLTKNLKIIYVDFETAQKNLLQEADVRATLGSGKEILVVINSLENLTEDEQKAALGRIAGLWKLNRHRFHTILNVIDKPALEQLVINNSELLGLYQNVTFMPVVSGKLLEASYAFFEERFQKQLTKNLHREIASTHGGIFTLAREYFRNNGSEGEVEIKLSAIWNRVPKIYREAIQKQILGEKISGEFEKRALSELEALGVSKLKVFAKHFSTLATDHLKILEKMLTAKEKELIKTLKEKKKSLVTRETAAQIIWGESVLGNYSDWAIDQFMSRLRRKLEMAGYGESLVTVKKGGYKWLPS